MKRISMLLTAALIGAAAACAESPDYSRFTTFYGQRATLFDMLPMDSQTIVMLGNSITNGCEWAELLGNSNVVNRGISGDTVEGIQARLGSIIKAAPAKIFLMIGVNDVSHDLSADSIATSIGELVHRIRTESPATKLYLQSLLPVNQSFERFRKLDGKEQVIRDINAMLPAIAEREGATFINLYPLLADEQGNLGSEYTNDGLHLLAPAYLVWRDAIMPYINE
ncbi:MAG: sialate O-acetylesterase [Muribaculaceae bacterium]|nr:sialate O-acetylesterase [Muribaculaceae bacterium]